MDLIYLDQNCFQRNFDDQRQLRIRMESLACQEIFERAERREIVLAWSFIHLDETEICPFADRKHETYRLSGLCRKKIGPNEKIRGTAKQCQHKYGLSGKDSLHLACAICSHARYFVTCDDDLRKKTQNEKRLLVMNPTQYVTQERSK